MTSQKDVICLENITYTYPGASLPVLNDLNLSIKPLDKIGMIAPNGSGKTTLLHVIMGLCRPEIGTIKIFGNTLKQEKDFVPIRSRVGLLFQDSDDQLFCPTVIDDVAFGPLNQGYPPKEAARIAREVLADVGLEKFEDKVTHRMSGGQKRLVALAAVLAMKPEVLLLDEPTAGLDKRVKERLSEIMTGLDIPFFLISHEFDFVSKVADKIYSMDNGRILTDEEVHIHRHEHIHRHGNHPHIHK